jgi:hypothetical protein
MSGTSTMQEVGVGGEESQIVIALLVKTLSYGLHDCGCRVEEQEVFLFRTFQTVGPEQQLTTGWTVRGSYPSGGEIFLTRLNRPWAHEASCALGTGSLSRRLSDWGVSFTTHSHLVPKL